MPFDYRNFQQKKRRYRANKGNRQHNNYHVKGKQSMQQKNKYAVLFSTNYNHHVESRKQSVLERRASQRELKPLSIYTISSLLQALNTDLGVAYMYERGISK